MLRLLFFLLLVVSSCKSDNDKTENSSWTEEQKRIYFQDSIASKEYYGFAEGKRLSNFSVFSARMFSHIKAKNKDPLIYAFEEPYIDTTKIDNKKSWLRVTVNPAFRVPYCLIVEKINGKTYLTSKMMNGYGDDLENTLAFSLTTIYSDTLYNSVFKELRKLDFWELSNANPNLESGVDGEGWTIEAIEAGKHNRVYRWVPQHSRDEATRRLGKLGIRLRETSKVLETWAIVKDKNSEQLNNQRRD